MVLVELVEVEHVDDGDGDDEDEDEDEDDEDDELRLSVPFSFMYICLYVLVHQSDRISHLLSFSLSLLDRL